MNDAPFVRFRSSIMPGTVLLFKKDAIINMLSTRENAHYCPYQICSHVRGAGEFLCSTKVLLSVECICGRLLAMRCLIVSSTFQRGINVVIECAQMKQLASLLSDYSLGGIMTISFTFRRDWEDFSSILKELYSISAGVMLWDCGMDCEIATSRRMPDALDNPQKSTTLPNDGKWKE